MDWLSPVVDGAAGLVSSFFQGFGAKKRQREYLQFQREENERARDYNFQLAQQQNSWNIDQWQRENEYNDPANQMARLRNAGINPDMFYNQGASGITSAASPQMTAGAPYTPMDYSSILQTPTIGESISFGLDNALKTASLKRMREEIENIEEDTKNKTTERGKIIAETGNLNKNIELSDSIIRVNGTVENLNKQQTQYVSSLFQKTNWEMSQIKQSIEVMKAQVQSMSVDNWYKVVSAAMNSRMIDGQLKRIAAQNALDYQELKFNVETFWDRVIQAKADTAIKWQQFKNDSLKGFQIDLENQRLEFDLDVDKKWRSIKEGALTGVAVATALALPIGKIGRAIKWGKSLINSKKATGLFNKYGKPIYRSLFDK